MADAARSETDRPPLNETQGKIVDAALEADAGLFVQASVPGSGKTYASGRLCAEFLLQRAAANVDRPAAGLAVVAFNRDAAAKLQPEVTDWLRQLVATGATPAARRVAEEMDDLSQLIGAFRRSETVGTVDALLAGVFRDIASELGFDDPRVDTDHAIDRLHRDAFEAVYADPDLEAELDRLEEAYPADVDSSYESSSTGDEIADILRTITETARDHGWTPADVREQLHQSRKAFYPDGPPSSLADVRADVQRFGGADADVSPDERWSADEIVAADRALHDGFETAAEREAYTVSTDGDEAAIAVSEEAIVVATGTFDDTDGPATAREAVTRVLDARLGTADRLADRSPDAEWVLRQAGTHDFVVGGENTSVDGADDGDRTYDPLAGTPLAGAQTSLIVSGASVELTGGEATNARADTALVNTGDAVSQSALESVYADSDATVSVTVSEAADGDDPGQRVHVTGEFGSAPSRL